MMYMKKIGFTAVVAGVLMFSVSCFGPKTGSVKLNNSVDSISYALGYSYAVYLKENVFSKNRTPFDSVDFKLIAKAVTKFGLSEQAKEMLTTQFREINENIYMMAISNELCLGKSYFTKEDVNMYINGEFERIKNEIATENLEKGQNFLEANGLRSGVITLESGLQYEILFEGDGKIPTADDEVKVHYHGTLIDGTVFDSSVERGEPSTFKTTGVIRGWIEALQLMPVGSKWKLYIPNELAYGQRGSGKVIGPNEALIFEVELLEIIERPIEKLEKPIR